MKGKWWCPKLTKRGSTSGYLSLSQFDMILRDLHYSVNEDVLVPSFWADPLQWFSGSFKGEISCFLSTWNMNWNADQPLVIIE